MLFVDNLKMNAYNFHLVYVVSGCVYNAKNTIGRADINLSAVVPFCGFLPHMRKMSENISRVKHIAYNPKNVCDN